MNIVKHRRRRRYDVNIVPMVDVMMVLLFFFLITMQFKEIRSVEIAPPSMSTSEQSGVDKPSVIGISKEGDYYFNDKKISLKELEGSLKTLADADKAPSIVLLADKEVPLHYATSAIDAVRLAKIKKLSIQSSLNKDN